MISKIDNSLEVKKSYALANNGQKPDLNPTVQNPVESAPVDSKLLQSYYVSFGSNKAKRERELVKNYTVDAEKLANTAAEVAKAYGHPEVTGKHVELSALGIFREFLEGMDAGTASFEEDSLYRAPFFFADSVTIKGIKDKKERAKLKPVIEQEMELLDEELSATLPKKGIFKNAPRQMTKELVDRVYELFALTGKSEENMVSDVHFLQAMMDMSSQQKDENGFKKFTYKLSDAVMRDSRTSEEKLPISIYGDKAKNVLKNLSLGTNMFVTHENNVKPTYLIDTIVKGFEEQGAESALNNANTRLEVFNDNITEDLLMYKAKEFAKDEKTNHIIVFNQDQVLKNIKNVTEEGIPLISNDFLDMIQNPAKNLKFVVVQNKKNYYATMLNPMIQKAFENFGEISVPVLSTAQAKQAFREQPLLMSKVDVPFSMTALDRTIEAASLLNGDYIENVQNLAKKMSSYYIGKKEVTETDAKKYIEEAKDLFKVTKEGSSVDIVFDTGKKLNDIMGKGATKKEAETFVRQIKTGNLGTKGAIIYSQDGSVGSGRKFTSKAIAGETKSPFVEINAMDFGTKETDLFGDVLSPEKSIKQLFSLLTTQAEASAHKSAVLHIDNFEYFSVGDLVSEYHQKAMSQLLREMENADKKGLNILVLGSVSNPELMGEDAIKSFKFIDKIEVESPARNINAREEILTNFIKKKGLKIAGTDADKKAIVKLMAETTEGFPFVYLVNLADKIKTVAFERGHKQIDKGDIIEAYLQLTTGRPASGPISQHRKEIVTSHECGHGFNLEYMRRLAEKQNIPWHLGDRVNFITLDPRGMFGGAMFGKDGGNEEHSFEKMFTEQVCDFGGHSAEKHFYNIDGSWGITADMEMATQNANVAVTQMGQGHNFGKKSIGGMIFTPSQKALEVMEKDVDTMLDNSRLVSDLITKVGTTFNQEFTKKYANLVGTGECIVHGDTFRDEIKDWLSKQPQEMLDEIEEVDKTILDIIEKTKNGIKYNMSELASEGMKKLYKSVAHYIK